MNMLLKISAVLTTLVFLQCRRHVLGEPLYDFVQGLDPFDPQRPNPIPEKIIPDGPDPEVPEEAPLPAKVVDMNNKPVKSGNSYKIMYGMKAGVGVVQKNDTCPLYMAQKFDNAVKSVEGPLKANLRILSFDNALFLLGVPNGDKDSLYLDEMISINFEAKYPDLSCNRSSLTWQVVDNEVRTGGPRRDRDRELANRGKFRVVKADFPDNRQTGTPVYHLQHCPRGTGSCVNVAKRVDRNAASPLLVVDTNNVEDFYIEFKKV